MDAEGGGSVQFLTPTEMIKQKSVALLFDCINLNSKSNDKTEKYGFVCKVKDLSIILERYTPKKARIDLFNWYKQLKSEIDAIKNTAGLTDDDKTKKILELRYKYSLEVHEQNQRILMNSPIIQVDVEGELDITDDDAIEVIRGGKRKDDGKLISGS